MQLNCKVLKLRVSLKWVGLNCTRKKCNGVALLFRISLS